MTSKHGDRTIESPPAKEQIANLLSNPTAHYSSLAELGRAVNPPVSRERARKVVRDLKLFWPWRHAAPPNVCRSCGSGVKGSALLCHACRTQKRYIDSTVELTCAGCGIAKRVRRSYARDMEKRGHKQFYHSRDCFSAHGGKPPSGSVASLKTIKPGEAKRIEHHDVSCISRKVQGKGSGYICTLAHAFYRTGWKGVVYHEGEHVAVVVRFPE